VDFAGFERTIASEYPESKRCHFQRGDWPCPFRAQKLKPVSCRGQEAIHSLLCSTAATFEKFAHHSLLEEYPRNEFILLPDRRDADFWSTFTRAYGTTLKSTARELRWLAALIGDLHQPLHFSLGSGAEPPAQNLTVRFEGKGYTLLEFWEDYLPKAIDGKHMDEDTKSYRKFIVTHAKQAEHFDSKHPSDLFGDWAKESAQIACEKIYKQLPAPNSEGAIELSETLVQQWQTEARRQFLVAGHHLAFVLELLVKHGKQAESHRHGRGLHHPGRHAWRHFFTNIFIGIPTVLALLLFFGWHLSAGAPSFLPGHLKL